jgi:endoglucanase
MPMRLFLTAVAAGVFLAFLPSKMLAGAAWGADAPPSQTRAVSPDIEPLRLKVADNKLVTAADGKPVLLRGVSVASLEFTNLGDHLTPALDTALNQWKANVIRLPVAQDRWFGRAAGKPWEPAVTDGGTNYRSIVDTVVDTAAKQRAYVLLDLHWSGAGLRADQGGRPAQYRMADQLSLPFWKDVATRYKDQPNVIFELYNEPYEISWEVWLNGGDISQDFDHKHYNFKAVGMQALYDTVRAAGSNNLVLINGMEWGYDLSGVLNGFAVKGTNIMYGTHPYPQKNRDWDKHFGKISEKYPVLMGEFGGDNPEHLNVYAPKILKYADDHGLHWTAWCLHPGCSPTLLRDWNFKPNAFGEIVKKALLDKANAGAK